MQSNQILSRKELEKFMVELDYLEEDMCSHDYKLHSKGSKFQCKEICFINACVHEQLGIQYESFFEYEILKENGMLDANGKLIELKPKE